MAIRFGPIFFLVIIGICVLFWTQLDGLLYPADVFPRFVLILLGGTAVIAFARDLANPGAAARLDWRFGFACAIAVSAVLYVWLIGVVGFYLASTAYLLVLYPVVNIVKDGRRLSGKLIGAAVVATIPVVGALYLLFTILLRINVPMLLEGGPI